MPPHLLTKFEIEDVAVWRNSCGNVAESTTHFFLYCTHAFNKRLALASKIKDIDKHIFKKNDSFITRTFLFGGENLYITDNNYVLDVTI